jgi:NAD(P)-dependent dehydrogenase (short-subunit alcohol dehydrogenase family)
MVAYNASKSGLLGVVRALATEWAPHRITVNAIGPGYIHTELTDALFTNADQRDALLRRIPMRRFGEPEDIAGPAVFLATDSAAYVTGQLLMVDGGWTAA